MSEPRSCSSSIPSLKTACKNYTQNNLILKLCEHLRTQLEERVNVDFFTFALNLQFTLLLLIPFVE